MPSLVCDNPPRCPEPKSRSPPLEPSVLPLPASSEFTLDTKLLKHGLCSADGDGDDLGSVEAGDPCRLGGEELSRLAVSESLCWPSGSDLTGRAVLSAPFMSALLFLFRLKLPLSNIFSQLGSSVQ